MSDRHDMEKLSKYKSLLNQYKPTKNEQIT